MERQGKMELAAKERESQRLQLIPKKWNRREEYEFLRVLTGYGVDMQLSTPMGVSSGNSSHSPDWTKFKQMAHLERKSDETLSDYYKVFVAMCRRQAGLKLSENERGLEGIIEEVEKEHAKLILDRLELLAKLREVSRNPQLEERLKLCAMNADTPDWWEPGRHDKELIAAVLKHGLYRSETFIFNDPNFSFSESEKRFIRELEAQIQRTIKLEAFNAEAEKAAAAEKAVAAAVAAAEKAAAAAAVKNEIIDLDDELLTTESVIKKETPVKAEVKPEESAEKPETKDSTEQEKSKSAEKAADDVEVTPTESVEKEALSEAKLPSEAEKQLPAEKEADVETEAKPKESDEKMDVDEPIAENGNEKEAATEADATTESEKSTVAAESEGSTEEKKSCEKEEETKMETEASAEKTAEIEDEEVTEVVTTDKEEVSAVKAEAAGEETAAVEAVKESSKEIEKETTPVSESEAKKTEDEEVTEVTEEKAVSAEPKIFL